MPRVANAPLEIFLAHHHLTPLINKTIRLQKLQSSAYAPSANMMGSNLWPYYFEVAKVRTQTRAQGQAVMLVRSRNTEGHHKPLLCTKSIPCLAAAVVVREVGSPKK